MGSTRKRRAKRNKYEHTPPEKPHPNAEGNRAERRAAERMKPPPRRKRKS